MIEPKQSNQRRQFLSLGFLGVIGAIFSRFRLKKTTGTGEERPESEKVKMLTPDGKLVELDKALYEQLRAGNKVSNQEILQWREDQRS